MTSQLFLRILHEDGHKDDYVLDRMPVDPRFSKLRWRLSKPKDGDIKRIVDVNLEGRITCDCADAHYRHNKSCKHKQALAKVGLLPNGK